MELLEELRGIRILARENKVTVLYSAISNLIGRFDTVRAKNSNIGKDQYPMLVDEINREISMCKESAEWDKDRSQSLLETARLLQNTLPAMLSDEDLKKIAEKVKVDGLTSKDFMAILKKDHYGLYNGGKAFQISKEIF